MRSLALKPSQTELSRASSNASLSYSRKLVVPVFKDSSSEGQIITFLSEVEDVIKQTQAVSGLYLKRDISDILRVEYQNNIRYLSHLRGFVIGVIQKVNSIAISEISADMKTEVNQTLETIRHVTMQTKQIISYATYIEAGRPLPEAFVESLGYAKLGLSEVRIDEDNYCFNIRVVPKFTMGARDSLIAAVDVIKSKSEDVQSESRGLTSLRAITSIVMYEFCKNHLSQHGMDEVLEGIQFHVVHTRKNSKPVVDYLLKYEMGDYRYLHVMIEDGSVRIKPQFNNSRSVLELTVQGSVYRRSSPHPIYRYQQEITSNQNRISYEGPYEAWI